MPSGPGVIGDELIYDIAKSVPLPIATFLLTSETKAENIIAHHKKTQTTTIQIVDELETVNMILLKNELASCKISTGHSCD